MKAVFNGTVIAESDDTVVVEGNHYFPPSSVRFEYFSEPTGHSLGDEVVHRFVRCYASPNVAAGDSQGGNLDQGDLSFRKPGVGEVMAGAGDSHQICQGHHHRNHQKCLGGA